MLTVSSENGVLKFIQTEEGRILPNGSSYIYEYFLKDHLGNTRAVVDHSGTIKQIQDYYPFGTEMNQGNALNTASNLYKYNGKEKQVELGLDQLDYGARFYDAEIGRWNVVDPLAYMFEDVSPYNYGMNNPILMIDPTGMAADTAKNSVLGPVVEIFRYAPKREPVSGFWGTLEQIWTGGNHNGYKYDWQGNPIGYTPVMGIPPDFSIATKPVKVLQLARDIKKLLKLGKEAVKTGRNVAGNAKKMSPDEIGEFLGAGKDWHKTSAKTKFLNQFKKELKGDKNADFYIDKTTKEVFLKSNKSNNWINTGQKFE